MKGSEDDVGACTAVESWLSFVDDVVSGAADHAAPGPGWPELPSPGVGSNGARGPNHCR